MGLPSTECVRLVIVGDSMTPEEVEGVLLFVAYFKGDSCTAGAAGRANENIKSSKYTVISVQDSSTILKAIEEDACTVHDDPVLLTTKNDSPSTSGSSTCMGLAHDREEQLRRVKVSITY
mmetsp:Transcript_3213/g.5856  ORF Transcript_3213/g.5856 Transcript_3213/m.5856 type:complete len:120 (-) Transcript_3213:421-780(-)